MKHEALIKELRGLADGSIEPEDLAFGICNHIDTVFGENNPDFNGYELTEAIAKNWEKYSGRPATPVPGDYSVNNVWTGEYGKLRRELCAFMADYLEANPDFEV